MRLCCFFNYAPLYRQRIYSLIDQHFDTQFYFGQNVIDGQTSGIAKLNYDIFKKKPIEFKNKVLFGKFSWRTKCCFLALKKFDKFIITGDFVFSYIPFLLLCKLLRKPVYGWGHGIKSRSGKFKYFNDFLYNNLSGFFAYGENGRNRLIELGYPADKIKVIYNSLSEKAAGTKQLESDIYKCHFGNTDPVLIFIGRATPQKKLDWLIDAVSTLNNNNIPCNLIIVGDGEMLEILKEQASKLNIKDRVWFFGECYNEGLNKELLYNADLCVSPGNVGLTALHAMSYGTPVISHSDFLTQMPEYETIIEGCTGTLYKKGDKSDMIIKIEEWLTDSQRTRDEIRENCYNVINDKWNADNQLKILMQVL